MRLAAEILKPDMMTLDEHLSAVELCLQQKLNSRTHYPKELASRLNEAGGKRIRPLLLLATFDSLLKNKANGNTTGTNHIRNHDLHTLASVAELVHMATLFHDDVIDDSDERRGQAAAQKLYGNKIAILVGDYVYAEAFSRLMEKAFLIPSQKLATTIQMLVEGEILQHEIVQKRTFEMKDFFKVVELKTASLFSWCAETGAWASACAGTPLYVAEGIEALRIQQAAKFGYHLGMAFQLIDDVIDTLSVPQDRTQNKNLNDEFYKEFMVSAPSFILSLLCLSSEQDLKLWQELPLLESTAQKAGIEQLMVSCRNPLLLEKCKEQIMESLQEAEKLCLELGSSETLMNLVLVLKERAAHALKGEKLM